MGQGGIGARRGESVQESGTNLVAERERVCVCVCMCVLWLCVLGCLAVWLVRCLAVL